MTDTDIHIAADDRPLFGPRGSSARWGLAALGVLLILIGAFAYYLWQRPSVPPAAPSVAQPAATQPAAPSAEARVEHPIEPGVASGAPPLPALGESDAAAREGLEALFGTSGFAALFRPQELIRNIVATIDNLPRKNVAPRLMPVKPVPGSFHVAGPDGALTIAADNASRYTPYVRAMDAVDSAKLVALYVRFYPLFQQAYTELGYPSRYFNDRLFEVIDHLLAAPDAPSTIALVQPKVLYEFADPAYADLSAGQKIMVRMGPENEARVKAKLRELKRALSRGI
ncbi:MAG TPA: DUF3014 domain-containing protein [Casimicrobiaceae bacterium]|nr:DUF3014 domain-containing protein [Casimicrobiaceae bacterium]